MQPSKGNHHVEAVCNDPFLFIVGVSKAGTTSLFRYLQAHPAIAACSPKEPFYFLPEARFFEPDLVYGTAPLLRYLELFGTGSETRIRLDGSSLYFAYPESAVSIKRVCPQAKVIVLLREPVSRLISCFQMARRHGWIASSMSFDSYARRMLQPEVGQHASFRLLLEEGRYSQRLRQWRQVFGHERLLVLWFDQLRDQPEELMQKVCRFAGIDAAMYQGFPYRIENPGLEPRFPRLQSLLRRCIPRGLKRLHGVTRGLTQKHLKLSHAESLWLKPVEPPPASGTTLAALYDYYAEDLAALTAFMGEPPPWNART